jgi:YD repeat-containing protein
MTKLTHPDGSFVQQSYDFNGNRKQRIDEDGNVINYEYNVLNQLIKIDYPGDNDSFFTYDLFGNRTCVSNSASVTFFTYDTSRRITSANQDGYLVTYEGGLQDNWFKINSKKKNNVSVSVKK